MSDFELETPIPKPIKYALIMIDRVGFPIFAFCLMSYMCFVTLDKVIKSVDKNTAAITALAHKLHIRIDKPAEDGQ